MSDVSDQIKCSSIKNERRVHELNVEHSGNADPSPKSGRST